MRQIVIVGKKVITCYIIFSSVHETHENFLSEDLHRKTFGNGKFVRFCDVKNIWAVFFSYFSF